MTLKQVTQVRRWLVLHGRQHPVEVQAWDMVLIAWTLGWVSVPSLMLMDLWVLLPVCLLGFLLPSFYARVRTHLHRAGRLRCDWLTAL